MINPVAANLMRTTLVVASAILFFCVRPAYAEAGDASPDSTPIPLNNQEIDMRLDTATRLLQSQEAEAQYWEYGWGTFDASTMLYSAIQASQETSPKARGVDIVQAGESIIGLADVIFRPLPAFNAGTVCEDIPSNQPNRLQCLAAKENLLEMSAQRAYEPYEILPHLGNAGFNLLAGLIVWRIGGRGQALATAIPGEMIGEIQLWTTPEGPMRDLEQYRLHFSPLLVTGGSSHSTTAGLMVSFPF